MGNELDGVRITAVKSTGDDVGGVLDPKAGRVSQLEKKNGGGEGYIPKSRGRRSGDCNSFRASSQQKFFHNEAEVGEISSSRRDTYREQMRRSRVK